MNFQKEYLKAEEAAEYLGISLRTLYSYVQNGLIKVHRPRRKIYISKEELIRFIKSCDNISEEKTMKPGGQRRKKSFRQKRFK